MKKLNGNLVFRRLIPEALIFATRLTRTPFNDRKAREEAHDKFMASTPHGISYREFKLLEHITQGFRPQGAGMEMVMQHYRPQPHEPKRITYSNFKNAMNNFMYDETAAFMSGPFGNIMPANRMRRSFCDVKERTNDFAFNALHDKRVKLFELVGEVYSILAQEFPGEIGDELSDLADEHNNWAQRLSTKPPRVEVSYKTGMNPYSNCDAIVIQDESYVTEIFATSQESAQAISRIKNTKGLELLPFFDANQRYRFVEN